MGLFDKRINDNGIEFPGVKYANPFLVPEYNQPMVGKTILPDMKRPGLVGTNATEYKMGIGSDGKEILIPRVVGGQLLSPDGAFERFRLTKEHFKSEVNPSSYSLFYDYLNKLNMLK